MPADHLAIKKLFGLRALVPRPCSSAVIGVPWGPRGYAWRTPMDLGLGALWACSLGPPALGNHIGLQALQGLTPENG